MNKKLKEKKQDKQEGKEIILTVCPKCESPNVIKELFPFYSLAIATQGIQINNWKCLDCGFIAPVFPEKFFDNKDKLKKSMENE